MHLIAYQIRMALVRDNFPEKLAPQVFSALTPRARPSSRPVLCLIDGHILARRLRRLTILELADGPRKETLIPEIVVTSSLTCQNHRGRAAELDVENRSWIRRGARSPWLHTFYRWGRQLPKPIAELLGCGAHTARTGSCCCLHWASDGRAADIRPNQ